MTLKGKYGLNPFKYWLWDDNLSKGYKIRAYLMNTLIWLVIIVWFIGLPIAILHNVIW